MPGFDGTGPRGQGPMTGGGRGRCRPATTADDNERSSVASQPQAGPAVNGDAAPGNPAPAQDELWGVGRGGRPRGGGNGRCFGGGRGNGRGRGGRGGGQGPGGGGGGGGGGGRGGNGWGGR